MNQDSHVTQRLTEAQVQKPIHQANQNMIWHLEWHGTEDDGGFVYRVAQFAYMRHAHEYILDLGALFNLTTYTLTRI